MLLGVGEAQFIQLLEYYKPVDQEGAADYWRYYEEMLLFGAIKELFKPMKRSSYYSVQIVP
jgi:hypothetical protein